MFAGTTMSKWLLTFFILVVLHLAEVVNMCPTSCHCDDGERLVNCANQNLQDVPRDLPTNTEILRLEGNDIHQWTTSSWDRHLSLQLVDLSYNNISDISSNAFKNNLRLQVLYLQGNDIQEFSSEHWSIQNQLQELYLGENHITSISKDAFLSLPNLRVLDLRSNNLDTIPIKVFDALTSLQQLDLRWNRLSNITTQQLLGLKSLNQLLLAGNKLKIIQNDAFTALPNLEVLDLSNNQLSSVQLGTGLPSLRMLRLSFNQFEDLGIFNFTNLPNLRELHLGHNLIATIPPHLFKNLTRLEILHLDNLPSLHFVDYRAFCGLNLLRILDMSENLQLSTLDKSLFISTPNMETIDFSNNNFSSFYSEVFLHLKNLKTLTLSGNPLKCNCAAKWLHSLSNSPELPNLSSGLQCSAPEAFKNYSISDIPVDNLTCLNAQVLNYTEHAFFKIGSEAVLKCVAGGEPVPSVTWITPWREVFRHNDYLNNVQNSDIRTLEILSDNFHSDHHWHDSIHYFHNTSHDRVQILANGDLYIDYVRRNDAGRYTCIAENPGGNDTVVIQFRLNYLIINEVKLTSIIIGFCSAGAFFGLSLLFSLLRFLCNRCEKKERLERKTRTIRKLLDNLEAYKTHQLDKLKDNYTLQVSKIKEQAVTQMDKMRENYYIQIQRIRDNCAGQMDRLRDNYNTQMSKIKGYSSHQIDKIRENYNSQMIKIRDYGSVQLEKLRETYKLQHQHLIKILEAMNIDHCRGVVVDTDCLRTDSVLFDQLNLDEALVDLTPSKPASRNSISDDEFVTAASDAEGISLDNMTGVQSENLSVNSGILDEDQGEVDATATGSNTPLSNSPCKSNETKPTSYNDTFTRIDLSDSPLDRQSTTNASKPNTSDHVIVMDNKHTTPNLFESPV